MKLYYLLLGSALICCSPDTDKSKAQANSRLQTDHETSSYHPNQLDAEETCSVLSITGIEREFLDKDTLEVTFQNPSNDSLYFNALLQFKDLELGHWYQIDGGIESPGKELTEIYGLSGHGNRDLKLDLKRLELWKGGPKQKPFRILVHYRPTKEDNWDSCVSKEFSINSEEVN
ncbi:hypothetical protein H9Q13_17720 [Pontibacter sp. JH31]|uniref:Uncharacterized protein n=1 Tax=Pontibacter aquaedesilientis TaxID=2766980 RepID=A0ABR7XL77_9BACT|nr:hypothetical protein [Pontibacter aquaedesilientis]MBD1399012.1 hypothetical protein [Pontibacter aquaedesilientis]